MGLPLELRSGQEIDCDQSVIVLKASDILVPSQLLLLEMREDLTRQFPDLAWEEWVGSAVSRWRGYLPLEGQWSESRPSSGELASLQWSELVPAELKTDKESWTRLVSRAWDVWALSQSGEVELHPWVAVAGTMGMGKSEFGEALAGGRPFSSGYVPERYKDNNDLFLFYRLLAASADPRCRPSNGYPGVVDLLAQVQGRVQSWFASYKFVDWLKIMTSLPNLTLVGDTPLDEDGVYCETQAQLGIASGEDMNKYRADNAWRHRLLPPYLRKPVLVGLWAPLEEVQRRVVDSRGRAFEREVPEGYLMALHRNTMQWMLGMCQAGVPTIIVDARQDFTPGMMVRSPVVQQTWAAVDALRKNSVEN